ncbi:hypothetical protein [Brevibacillus parabrevis]|nr:hypothetical protein [Brevibacillus parabrevis]MDR4997982.1 hypothetical protein [Brevibacillus parabrevis]
MKKILSAFCSFFGAISALNIAGVLKAGFLYEPLPPHMREESSKHQT